jgi:hypothetical protein
MGLGLTSEGVRPETAATPRRSMRVPQNPKPRPARPPEAEAPPPGAKPTPVRGLGGAELRQTTPSGPSADAGPGGLEADVSEVAFESDGATWRVQVLGRSGRAEGRSPPLLLLGFWGGADDDGPPVREATVVARALSELTLWRLEAALEEASSPPQSDRRKPFFEGAGQGRRGGGSRGDA